MFMEIDIFEKCAILAWLDFFLVLHNRKFSIILSS